MQILVIEDEVDLAQHISRVLIETGHEPTLVHDGETKPVVLNPGPL